MAIGAAALLGSAGYIMYMRKKYEGMGYYAAISEDGTEQFRVKRSKWDWKRTGLWNFSSVIQIPYVDIKSLYSKAVNSK